MRSTSPTCGNRSGWIVRRRATEVASGPAAKLAHVQGALLWEHTARSATRLWIRRNDRAGAAAMLQPVYGRFTGGFDPADLKAAKSLLSVL